MFNIDMIINNEISYAKNTQKCIKSILVDLKLNAGIIEKNEYKRLVKKAKYAYREMRKYENKLKKIK